MRCLVSVFLAVAILSASSCGTALVRSHGDIGQDFLYLATTVDVQAFYEAGIKGEPPISILNSEAKNGIVLRLHFMVGGLVDLPVSIFIDTILILFDLYAIGKADDDANE